MFLDKTLFIVRRRDAYFVNPGSFVLQLLFNIFSEPMFQLRYIFYRRTVNTSFSKTFPETGQSFVQVQEGIHYYFQTDPMKTRNCSKFQVCVMCTMPVMVNSCNSIKKYAKDLKVSFYLCIILSIIDAYGNFFIYIKMGFQMKPFRKTLISFNIIFAITKIQHKNQPTANIFGQNKYLHHIQAKIPMWGSHPTNL